MTEIALSERIAELPENESAGERQKTINLRRLRRTTRFQKNNINEES